MIEQYVAEVGHVAWNYAPELLAGGSAFLAGLGVNHVAEQKAQDRQQPLINEWGLEELPEVQVERLSRKERIGNFLLRVTPPVALEAGLAAALGVAAFSPVPGGVPKNPTIEIVMDHSGATGETIDRTPPVAPTINQITKSFNKSTDSYNINVWVESGAQSVETDVPTSVKSVPTGFAPLADGLSKALEQTAIVKNGDKKAKDTAILVITNGNPIGDPTNIVYKSKEQGNTPISVVNVEGSQATSPSDVSDYQAIAFGSHGKYWNANSANVGTVVKKVEASLVPIREHSKGNPYQGILLVSAAVAGLSAVRSYMKSSKSTLERKAQKEGK